MSLSDGERSLGSGFVIGSGRRVVTNAHLASGPRILVIARDGARYLARLLETDEGLDLAVLVLDAPALTALPIRRDPVRVGETVIALGNPFGSGITATRGIVSAEPRVIGGIERLQTDATINPGNSGGPLLDVRGRVVGVVNARTAGAQGIGLAVPGTRLLRFLDELPNQGEPVSS